MHHLPPLLVLFSVLQKSQQSHKVFNLSVQTRNHWIPADIYQFRYCQLLYFSFIRKSYVYITDCFTSHLSSYLYTVVFVWGKGRQRRLNFVVRTCESVGIQWVCICSGVLFTQLDRNFNLHHICPLAVHIFAQTHVKTSNL